MIIFTKKPSVTTKKVAIRLSILSSTKSLTMQNEPESMPTEFEDQYQTVKTQEININLSRGNPTPSLVGQPDYLTMFEANGRSTTLIAAAGVLPSSIHNKFADFVKSIIPMGFQAVKASVLDNNPSIQDLLWGGEFHKTSNIILEAVFNISDSDPGNKFVDPCHNKLFYRGAGICAQLLATTRLNGTTLGPELCAFFVDLKHIDGEIANAIAKKFSQRVGRRHDFIKNGLFMIPIRKPDLGVMYFCVPNDGNAINTLKKWRDKIRIGSDNVIGIEDNLIFPVEEWHVLLCFYEKFYP